MTKVTVVIPFINLWDEYTLPCLQNLEKQDNSENLEIDIILVSNQSSKEQVAKASEYCLGEHRLRANQGYFDERVPLAKIWNTGIKEAFSSLHNADYVLVSNNDVLYHKWAISILEDNLKAHPEMAILSAWDIRDRIRPDEIYDCEVKGDFTETAESGANFAAFMISKEGYDKVGQFDESFNPAYFEDNDYDYRIKLAGMKSGHCPQAIFYHYGSRTQNSTTGGMCDAIAFTKCRNYFVEKWGGVPGQETFNKPFNK